MRFIDRRNCKSAFEKGESREIKSMGALTQEAVKIAEQNGLGVMQNRGGAFRVIRACALAPTRTSSLPLKKSMHLSKT